ncbi:MAG: hypothetical protein AB7L66_16635 [Gemmatimonadales bacterium]
MSPRATPEALARLAAPLRRAGVTLAAGTTVGGLLGALAVGAWLVRLGVVRSPLWVPAAWLVALAGVVAAAWLTRRRFRRLTMGSLAATLDSSPGWRQGGVASVLEGASAGTSADLYQAADRACADALAARGPAALEGLTDDWRRRGRIGLAVAGFAAVALLGARPGSGPVALLWSPAEAWGLFVAPVQIRVDREVVDRGESVEVDLRAAGRRTAELWLRGKGEAWRSEVVSLDSAGRANRTLSGLEGDLFAFVRSGGRTSDTVAVHVRLPAFLGRLTLTANYPAYLKLDDEALPATGDTLLLPEGTRLVSAGETTASLRRAWWTLGGTETGLEVEGESFRGRLTPRASGVLRLGLETVDGAPIGGDTVMIPLVIVPDLAPEVEVPVPGQDTMPVLGKEVGLVVDARDDHGLTAVTVVATRRRGGGPPSRTPVPLPGGLSDRALLSLKLDLTEFALVPGDTVTYWVEARDNAPAAQVGRSGTFVLVVPTATEARSEQRSATREVARTIDSLVAESRQLQRQTEDLSRERQRGTSEKGEPSLSFEDAKRAEQIARDQQEMLDQAERLDEQLEQLERASDRSGIVDSAFRRQLEEIRAQLDKAISPEMRRRLEELREALKNLDPQAAREALEKLADAQQKLKEAMERTRELFKRAALEGELSSLEQESKELAEQQEAWNDKVEQADSSLAAAQEEGMSQRADSLAKGLEEAAKQLDDQGRKDELQQNAKEARQASQQMQNAAQSAKNGKRQQAKQQGQQAAQQMQQIQKDVQEQREAQQNEWKQEVIDAIDRALAETARLSQRQLALSGLIGRGLTIAQARQEQGVIEEGVQKLLEQVLAVSGKNALISPQIGAALVQARLQMGRAREAVSSASANIREATEQAGEAVDALNVAAFQMLRSRDDVSGASSASGVSEAVQRMQQMAGQQGSMSQEGQNLLSMLAGQQLQARMQALAQQQRQMAEELDRLRAETQMEGTRDMAEEARELARKLEAGRLDRETVERQERLFKKMLDAGRTLQGEEKDEKKERQSEVAKGDSVSVPAPLRRLLDESGRIRFPSWEELQRLSPEERRLVTDYFRRLTAGSGR